MSNSPSPSAAPLFRSFFQGGFECSSQVNHERRVDQLRDTGHDIWPKQDYERLQSLGIQTARDGVRWHRIETAPYKYDWSSVLPMVRTARDTNTQVIWDLCHYGWPDDLDVFSPQFLDRFGAFAGAFAYVLRSEGDTTPLFAPVNEISYLSWAAGHVAHVRPFERDKGMILKAQLAQAAGRAIEAVWQVSPLARIIHPEPAIHVHAPVPATDYELKMAQGYSKSIFEGWDMVAGRLCPEFEGQERYLDVLGVNYYPHNQWVFSHEPYHPSQAVGRDHPRYHPFRLILADIWERYRRPLFIAETGSDGDDRVSWLRYLCHEVRAAMEAGVPIEGICLYPIVNFPAWDDRAHLHNGLWDYPADSETGERETYVPLLRELKRQMRLFDEFQAGTQPMQKNVPPNTG